MSLHLWRLVVRPLVEVGYCPTFSFSSLLLPLQAVGKPTEGNLLSISRLTTATKSQKVCCNSVELQGWGVGRSVLQRSCNCYITYIIPRICITHHFLRFAVKIEFSTPCSPKRFKMLLISALEMLLKAVFLAWLSKKKAVTLPSIVSDDTSKLFLLRSYLRSSA